MPSFNSKLTDKHNTKEVYGDGLLAACFVGACPVAKGVHREVSYRHKECACYFLQEELREAHLHRRIVTIAYQQKDAKEAKEDRHADD